MINLLAVIGAITICCILLLAAQALYLRHTTGLWPSQYYQRLRNAEIKTVESAHKVYTARIERDLRSALNGKIAEIEQLHKRISDLKSDIVNLQEAKDNSDTTFLTFLSTLKE
jgi:hypothetical protein